MNSATTAPTLNDITILIHTFKRPDCLERILKSIKEFYPEVETIVYDDSEYDKGLSWGRNYLVNQAKTKYVFMCDDDCIFNENVDLQKLLDRAEKENIDILGIDVPGVHYNGFFDVQGNTVYMRPTDNDCDFVINVFLAKREALLKHPWDERFKIGEHFAYFYQYRGQMNIQHEPMLMDHWHTTNPDYETNRKRAWEFVKMYMREVGLKKRVDMNGHILDIESEDHAV